MRVEEAATTSPSVRILFFFFLLLYIVLGTVSVLVLRRMFYNNPAEVEMETWTQRASDKSTLKGEHT